MIDCDKCVYRKDGECKYKKDGCNYIPVDEPAIPISVIEQKKAEIESKMETVIGLMILLLLYMIWRAIKSKGIKQEKNV